MRMTDKEKLEMIRIIEMAYINDDSYVARRLHFMVDFDYSLYKHDNNPVKISNDDYRVYENNTTHRYYGYDCVIHLKDNKTKRLGELFLKTVSRSGK